MKPENVLVLGNGAESSVDWQFKFANFGVSAAKSKSESPQGEAPSGGIQNDATYGTYPYPLCWPG